MANQKWNHDWLFGRRNDRERYSAGEDDYSEESGGLDREERSVKVRMPHDKDTPASLNGPVIVVQEGRKKDGK